MAKGALVTVPVAAQPLCGKRFVTWCLRHAAMRLPERAAIRVKKMGSARAGGTDPRPASPVGKV